jgi:AcrR family transcriptional regulator
MKAAARKGRPPATDSAETRRQILAAARARFGQDGYDKTTNKDIAAAAGITQAAIYHYFPSKADVFVAAYREMQTTTFEGFEIVTRAAEGLAEKVKAVLDLAAVMHSADRTLAAFTAVAPIEIQRHPAVRRSLGDEPQKVYRFFSSLVDDSADSLDPEVDRDSVVNLLVATSTGFAQFGATARGTGTHQRAIGSFKRLIDGTLFRPDVVEAQRARGPQPKRRIAARPATANGADAREKILMAARTCFGRDGYDKTTNRDIAGVAGFTAGAIYRYFPSKQELFVAVYRDMQGKVFSHFDAAVAGRESLPEKIEAILDLSVDLHAADRTLATFTAIAPVEIQRHPEIRRQLGDDPVAVYRFFRRLVVASAGDLAPDVDPDSVVDLLVAVATGFSQFGATTRSARPHREAIGSFERLLEGTLFAPALAQS